MTSFLVKVKAGHDDPSHTNWVENEVAGMHIARHALARMKPSAAHVVPEVYAWHSEEHDPGSGCIIMQDKRGEPLSKLYGFMGSTSREGILETVAAFFAMFHNAPVPRGVRTYGGLTIDHVEPHHRGIGCAEGSDETEKWRLVLDEVVSRLKVTGHDVEIRKRLMLEELVPWLVVNGEDVRGNDIEAAGGWVGTSSTRGQNVLNCVTSNVCHGAIEMKEAFDRRRVLDEHGQSSAGKRPEWLMLDHGRRTRITGRRDWRPR